jgi:hypothetical protein
LEKYKEQTQIRGNAETHQRCKNLFEEVWQEKTLGLNKAEVALVVEKNDNYRQK